MVAEPGDELARTFGSRNHHLSRLGRDGLTVYGDFDGLLTHDPAPTTVSGIRDRVRDGATRASNSDRNSVNAECAGT